MEPIELDITETNELTFKIQIEGADRVPANIRLVCESNEISYMFKARQSNETDTFDFVLPAMKNKLQEGLYKGRIEVLIENKYFAPVEFDMDFKQPVKVVAEAIQKRLEPQKTEPKVSITASQVKKPVSSSVREADKSDASQTLRDKFKKR